MDGEGVPYDQGGWSDNFHMVADHQTQNRGSVGNPADGILERFVGLLRSESQFSSDISCSVGGWFRGLAMLQGRASSACDYSSSGERCCRKCRSRLVVLMRDEPQEVGAGGSPARPSTRRSQRGARRGLPRGT